MEKLRNLIDLSGNQNYDPRISIVYKIRGLWVQDNKIFQSIHDCVQWKIL